MKISLKITIQVAFLLLFLGGCESGSSSNLTGVLAQSALTYPTISTLEPNQIYSSFTLEGVVYPAPTIQIKGRNFSAILAENVVSFNGISATIQSATTTEILAIVPDGVSSGVLTVAKSGGTCTSIDKKSGVNCGGADIYVNCYSAFESAYGSEALLKFGSENSVEFTEALGTKAFRVDLPEGDRTLLLNCPSDMSVTLFSNSCSPTKTNSVLPSLTNPQFQIKGGYTMQFFVTTQSGSCTFSIF
jgi:hypothetical protein